MYCGTCGAPLPSGANFCGHCGTSQVNLAYTPTPTPGVIPTSAVARPSLPLAAPLRRKSPALAAFLELLIAGCGLFYVGRWVTGILAFVFTSAFFLAGLLLLGGINGRTHPVAAARVAFIFLLLLLVWLLIRMFWAGFAAQRRNRTVTTQPAPVAPITYSRADAP